MIGLFCVSRALIYKVVTKLTFETHAFFHLMLMDRGIHKLRLQARGERGYPNVANLSTKGWSKILKFYNRSLWMAPYKSYRQRVILMIHSKRVNALFQCIQTCNAPLRLSEYLWESQLGFSWLYQCIMSWGEGK